MQKSQNQRRVDVFALIIVIVVANQPSSYRHIRTHRGREIEKRDSCCI